MIKSPVTAEELSKELEKYLNDICQALNRDKDVTIKKKRTGDIKLVCQSQKIMNLK